MTYLPSFFLKEIIEKEGYEGFLRFASGCMIYVSKKELVKLETKKEYYNLLKSGLKPSQAIKRLSELTNKTVRTIKRYEQSRMFIDD